MKTPTTSAKAYTPRQLAEFWNCSRETILRAIRRGDLPATRIGPQTIRILAADAAKFYAINSNLSSVASVAPVAPGSTPERRCGRPWGS